MTGRSGRPADTPAGRPELHRPPASPFSPPQPAGGSGADGSHDDDSAGEVTLFLAGDVMTGRAIDQVLPHPGDPRLWEEYVHDAGEYVALAEAANGPVTRPVDFRWPWGDALATLDRVAPAARVVNVETTVTRVGAPAAGKSVHYRMTPENLPCLSAARPDVCGLANNHVLDFGRDGLARTLAAFDDAGMAVTGAGSDAEAAARPVPVPLPDGGRLVVAAYGDASSGIPPEWAAGPDRPGVNLLPDLSPATADRVVERLDRYRRPGDLTVVSLHWGANWGYQVPAAQVGFAHRLIDAGVDVVHGHSSHHPRPVELYRGKLILYGCGDLVNDYEGITGVGQSPLRDRYRDDLRLLYFPTLDRHTGRLLRLRLAPMAARRLRLAYAEPEAVAWLREVLHRVSEPYGVRFAFTTGALPPAPVLESRPA